MIHTIIAPDLKRDADPLLYYTKLFLVFLQGIFKNRDEGDFKWVDDIGKTEILLADQANNYTDTNQPRIITARGPVSFMPMYMDDMITRGTDMVKKRTILVQTSMAFNCIAKFGLEAQKIAFIVAHALSDYYLLLQQNGIHKVIRSISVSPETPSGAVFSPEVVPEGVLVQVSIPFIIRWTTLSGPTDKAAARELQTFINGQRGFNKDETIAKQPQVMKELNPPVNRIA